MATVPPLRQEEIDRDLGLGSRVADDSSRRILNRDGSFNVRRTGLPFYRTQNFYHHLLTMTWIRFFLLIFAGFALMNLLFAFLYTLCGADALHGSEAVTSADRFLEAFFFSVQTSSTVGYGHLAPRGLAANIIVSFEAVLGLLGFALATGLLFARFSRPSARIKYSTHAVIAPYRDGTGLMFRIANVRNSELFEVNATVTLARTERGPGGSAIRKFYPLALERTKVTFFPLHWVIVHPIDATSPLAGATPESLANEKTEILILLSGVEETFSQTVHSRSSYTYGEIHFGKKFADMFIASDHGIFGVDLRKIDQTEHINK
ncbi:MAG TPA: ion channel [Bacteroidota bacterium]|nr:ion channel [Bacteroidota bacterium]